MQIKPYLMLLIAILSSYSLQATTLTVNTLTDIATGSGTSGALRYLMGIAVDGDTIVFNPSLAGSIILDNSLGNLPQITIDNLTITGNLVTSSGVTISIPKVTIDGQNLPASAETIGFDINNSNTTANYNISNLCFINFVGTNLSSSGIKSINISGTINIDNCFFGTTDGTDSHSNRFGIVLQQGNNTATLNLTNSIITASTDAPFQAWSFNEANVDNCIINNNPQPAMDFQFCNSGSITSNLVGVSADGLTAEPNENGILLTNCNNFIIGGSPAARNVCSGNGGYGIQLSNCTNCEISYNYLGTNITGTAEIHNIGDGCSISSDTTTVATNIIISNNLISGNFNNGIRLSTSVSPAAITNCSISNNLIGTNATGTAAIGNFYDGIIMNGVVTYSPGPTELNNQGSISNNIISDNLISGNNSAGIRLANNCTNNIFSNNKIGTKIDGTSSLPNGSHGIFINSYDTACNSNIIGVSSAPVSGIVTTYGNIIAYNTGNGINVTPVPADGSTNPPSTAPQTTLNSFLENSIFSNANPQINLATNQNNNQAASTINQAVLKSTTGSSDTLYVSGTAPSSLDSSNLRLDFFATPAGLSTTNPQGKIYLGTIDSVAANSSYQQLFTDLQALDSTYYITNIATAYDNTDDSTGDSSQFGTARNPTYDTAITLGTLTATPNPIALGNSTTLSITFSGGTAPYTAQWSNGHTTSSISSSPITYSPSPTTNTSYYVTITDALGNSSATSNTINVVVDQGPSITSISASPTQVNWEQDAEITVGFTSGISPYTAHWQDYVSGIIVNELTVSGIITSPYIRSLTPELTTLYSLQIGDNLGMLSTPANITIPVGPHITSFTANNNPIALGSSTTLNVEFTGGTSPFSATWYANSTVITGATSTSSITVTPTTTTSYYVIITDANNLYATSSPINITVDTGPNITSISATPATVLSGASSNLEVIFSGGIAPYTARWSDSTTVNGVSSPYTRTVNPTATTTYSVQIIDSLALESSPASALVTVNGSPTISTLTIAPSLIAPNQSATITLSFDPGSGPCAVNWGDGTSTINATSPISHTVTPANTTTYTVTVSNDFGDCSQDITANVVTPPSNSLFVAHLLTKYYGRT